MVRRTRPGISRFRVRCCASPRNDGELGGLACRSGCRIAPRLVNARMPEKPKKPQKLKARLPRGLEDRDPAAIRATREMVEKNRAVYQLFVFGPVGTPAMGL